MLQSAVSVKLDSVVEPAKTLFNDWMSNSKRIGPNIRDVVYAAGIKFGGEDEWNYCWSVYQKTQVPSEKTLMLQALGATSDPWLLQRYLLRSLDREKVRPQDVETVIGSVATNPEGQFLAWRHLKAYWHDIQALFGNGTLTMGGLISVVTSDFFTEHDYREVNINITDITRPYFRPDIKIIFIFVSVKVSEFFKKVDVGSGKRALDQSLETIRFNIHWVKNNVDVLDDWLIGYLDVHSC